MSGRLDDEKLETLRSWGTGIAADTRPELRAAGKAILILVEEIEPLQVDAWHPREAASAEDARADRSVEELAEEFFDSDRSAAADSSSPGRARRRLTPRSRKAD